MCRMQERQLSLSSSLCSYLPLKPKSCAFPDFDTLRHILIIFGGGIGIDQ